MAGGQQKKGKKSQDSKSHVIPGRGEIVLPDDAFQRLRYHLLYFSIQINPGQTHKDVSMDFEHICANFR